MTRQVTTPDDQGRERTAARSYDDSLAYIRRTYHVPAEVGCRVICDGRPGVIVGGHGAYILVQTRDAAWPTQWHPTWRIQYMRSRRWPSGHRHFGRRTRGDVKPGEHRHLLGVQIHPAYAHARSRWNPARWHAHFWWRHEHA